MGAPSFIETSLLADPIQIAFSEFASGSAPLNVQRFPDASD